jgi:hypothetical protein
LLRCTQRIPSLRRDFPGSDAILPMYYNARRNARAASDAHGIALAYPARQEQFLIGVCAGRGLSCRNKNKMAARATQPSPGALPSS